MMRGQCQLLTSSAVTAVLCGTVGSSMHCPEVGPVQKPFSAPVAQRAMAPSRGTMLNWNVTDLPLGPA